MSNIFITGSSSGIGLQTAKLFLQKGHTVFGSFRKQSQAQTISKELGQNFHPVIMDVTSSEQIDLALKIITEKLQGKGLDLLVNNSGVAFYGPIQEVSIEKFKHQFQVNVMGVLEVTQKFLPLLGAKSEANHKGKVMVISSLAGVLTRPFLGPYSASKHAVEAMFDALRRELYLYKIPVSIIQPGPIKTPIWDKAKEENNIFYEGTIYEKPFRKLTKAIEQIENIAIPASKVSETIYKAFVSRKPKNRYIVTPKKFFFWLMMYGIPDRWLDKYFQKEMNKLID